MIRSIWYKFMINVGINQASAVLRAPYGVFQTLPEAREVMESAMRETVALSNSMGTGLRDTDVAAWYDTLSRLAPDGKTSMLQDVEAGRKTEVEAFAGAVIELGEAAGLAVPVNRTLFNLIRAIERGYGRA
jgi:2-dehydropantoate 2-reductase